MKRLLSVILFTCACWSLQAQVNYVKNPDFEQFSYCPNNFDQIDAAKFWNAIDTISTSYCRPDYFNSCSQVYGTPYADHFYQYPRSGNGLAMVRMFDIEDPLYPPPAIRRDYLQGELMRPLRSGKSYCISFFVSVAEASQYAINHIGAYLDDARINTSNNCSQPITTITPQVYTSSIINDTANWVRIEGDFIASGTERFITIGNFFSKANTRYDSVSYIPRLGHLPYSWYLIDDVSVIESDLPADAGPDRHITAGDSTYIGRPREVGLECKWYKGTTLIDSGAGIWVRPSQTTTYRVEQTLCGVVRTDSVTVSVWAVGIGHVNGHVTQQYHLSPNPNNGAMVLQQAVAMNEQVKVEVQSATGAHIYSTQVDFKAGAAALDLRPIVPGFYWLRLQDREGKVSVLRFVVDH